MAQFSADKEAGSRSFANIELTHTGGSWVAYLYEANNTESPGSAKQSGFIAKTRPF